MVVGTVRMQTLLRHSLTALRSEVEEREARRAASHLILHPADRGKGGGADGQAAPIWAAERCDTSLFCRAAVARGYLSEEQMRRAAERYHLGMTRDGGVIFWQTDRAGVTHDGKVMYYREDCHRDRSPERHPTWVSSVLKAHYDSPVDFCPAHCLFGLHLLSGAAADESPQHVAAAAGNAPQQVAVVEAEKTAVILSEHFPDRLWMAAGGLGELTAEKLLPLRGCAGVTLFPDTDDSRTAYDRWWQVAQEASPLLGLPVAVSALLELEASPAQKAAKIDLVDFLFH